MSGKAPKQKGNRIERECVNLAQGYGFKSRRAWGSDGRSLGWHEEVDMVIETNGFFEGKLKFQVKARKAIADYLKPCEHVDGQILREDGDKDAYVVIRYKDLLNILKMLTG
mgnify:FL=1|jgi:Holliday junction resolvase|tara:strand:+ start:3486 stop:3818 length:333 start_codon:yes stop_codon:yes gene_type:complete